MQSNINIIAKLFVQVEANMFKTLNKHKSLYSILFLLSICKIKNIINAKSFHIKHIFKNPYF